jgi:four helix bundle protein
MKDENGRPPYDICDRTFQFALRIVKLSQWLEEKPGTPRTLARQLLRAGTSIGANVEEGQAGQSRADFVSKYSIARKGARETKYWLRLLAAAEICKEARIAPLLIETDELIRILTAIIKKAQNR